MELNQLRITAAGRVKDNPMFASFEHLIPKSHGGSNHVKNKVLSHQACNNSRARRKFPHDPIYGVNAMADAKMMTMNKACDAMRVGAALMKMSKPGGGVGWYIVPGSEVSEATAMEIQKRADVRPNEDGLFPGISQTWRIVSLTDAAPRPSGLSEVKT